MKKAIALILALVLCLSLCACGGNNAAKGKKSTYKLGDTIKTELFEITPSFTGYARELASQYSENSLTHNIIRDMFGNARTITAAEGKVFMYGEIQIEYVGNEKNDVNLQLDVSASYDDGYIFDEVEYRGFDYGAGDFSGIGDDGWGFYEPVDYISTDEMVFEPLSTYNSRLLRYCIEVPEQVETNTDKPLLVTFSLNKETFTYDFRSAKVRGSN